MQINFVYDSSVDSAPSGFKTALAAAAGFLDNLIITPITVNIQVGWQEDNGQRFTGSEIGLGGPTTGVDLTYAQLRSDLAAAATSGVDATAIASLPISDPTNGGSFFVSRAQEKALGLIDANSSGIDGSVAFGGSATFNFDPNNRAVPGQIDFVGTAEHELTHALGRYAGVGLLAQVTPLDLFRYAAPGVRQFSTSPGYFSIDGGTTNLQNFDTTSDTSDWASSASNDAFNATVHSGVVNIVTAVDVTEMDVLGFTMGGSPLPVAISGTRANLSTLDQSTIAPFSGVTIRDQNNNQTETVTIQVVSPANGTLTNLGGGSYDPNTGVYTAGGSLAAVNAAVRGLVFVPTSQQVGTGKSVTTNFIVRVTDSAGSSAIDSATRLTATPSGFSGSCSVITSSNGAVTVIPMDTRANVTLLQPLLTSIGHDVVAGNILSGSPGSTPGIPAGKSGLLLVSSSGQATMPSGYATAIVATSSPVTISGGSSNGQLVAAGQGGLTFTAGSGTGSVFGGGGNNSVFVGNGSGSQFIALGNGSDTINVLGGNNTISGGNGRNLIFLGAGQNSVKTGGADTVSSGTGSASVTASGAGALVFGNFTSSAGPLNAVLNSTQATISAALSATSVTTSGTNAVVFGSFAAASGGLSVLDTGVSSTVYAGFFGAAATLAGSNGLLYGNFNNTPGALGIRDSGFADTISAANSALAATLSGSQTLLFGGYGAIAGALNVVDTGRADTIATGNSNATISGGASGSGLLVYGGGGSFNFVGGAGSATVVAGIGPSSVTGGSGGTTLYGSGGSSVALGGSQGVLYVAGGGNETLNASGASGGNELVGGSGANLIVGGHGSDTLFAGAGSETLGGGGGSDAFAFVSSRTSGNAVTILDFASDDTIYLTGYGTNDAATALSNATAVGGNTTITLTDHTQVTFIGVGSASTLQGHVFSF